MNFKSLVSFSCSSIIIGIVVLNTLPSSADEITPVPVEEVETFEPATGTLNDLNELPSKNLLDWSWNDTPEGFSELYRIDTQSYQANPSVDFLEEQNEWKERTQGDKQPPSASIPLTEF